MKVYFACSVRSGGDSSNYLDIIKAIKATNAEVISEIFVNDAINYGGSPLPVDEIYTRDTNMIQEADAVIAEVSHPSLGIGYELAYAENLEKPTLCLFKEMTDKPLSAMIEGNPYNSIVRYKNETIPTKEITAFLAKI